MIIPYARCMSTTNSLPPISFATRGLILRPLRSNSLEKARKDCVVADNNLQQSENIVLCDQESHILTLISIKVGDRNLTTPETNGVDSKWVKGLTLFCENYYFTKKIINLRRKSRIKVQKRGVKVQKSGIKVHITNLQRKVLFCEENYCSTKRNLHY